MKKFLLKEYFPLIISLISLFALSFLWESITLPYNKNNEILGNYSNNNHHQFNDTLRFLLFILIPLLLYLLIFLLIDKENALPFKQIFKQSRITSLVIKKNNRDLYLFILIFFLIILFHFLLIGFPNNKLDVFHEGQLLTGAMNYNLKNELWVGSYLNTGLFYDILNTKFAWYLFDKENISTYRYFHQILNYLFYVLLIFFSCSVTKIISLERNQSNFLFITLTSFCIFFYIISYPNAPNYRDFFSILFLILLSMALISENYSKLIFFIIGNLSILSLLWSLDRGVFLNATLIVICFLFIFQKKFLEVLFLFLGVVLGWIVFLLIFGPSEFSAFVNNSINILKFNEMWNGIIHPVPFSDQKDATRATKALIVIFLNGAMTIRYIFDKRSKFNSQSKNFLIIYYAFAFFYYKIGLSRSDGGHIAIGSSLNFILFIFFITYKLIDFDFKKLNFISKFKIKSYGIYFFFIIILFNSASGLKINSLKNFFNYKSKFISFINLDDEFYLTTEYLEFYKKLKIITINDKCIQNFNYDPTIYYLLKKSSCTKFYKVWSVASSDDQKSFVDEIKKSKADKLVIDNLITNSIYDPSRRFKIIDKYISSNYRTYEDINNFRVLIKNND